MAIILHKMDKCSYLPVNKEEDISKEKDKNLSWKPLFRQLIVCSSVCSAGFLTGLSCGSSTVIIPQLRKDHTIEEIDDEMASWLYSVPALASIPWFVLHILSSKIGRKYPSLFAAILSFISNIGLYCSWTPIQILVSEILMGPLIACQITVAISVLIEYTSIQYRGMFLAMSGATWNWGMWVANSLGRFFHWKTIAITACSIYNVLTILFWCESPSWLASKNRYEECIKYHRWMKGDDTESEKELNALLKSSKEDEKTLKRKKKHRSYRTMLDKSFYLPIILNIATISLTHTSGNIVCSIYAIDIIKKITSSETVAYTGMLSLDAVTVIGMYVGGGLLKYVNRRPLLLIGAAGGAIFNVTLASYLYLCKLKAIEENHYMSLTLLAVVYLFISVGPLVVCFTIYGEIMPMKYRTSGMLITAIWMYSLTVVVLKTAPYMFITFGLHGCFLFYGVTTLFIVLFLYKLLPETKDKTVQDIEEYFGKVKKEEMLEDCEI